MRQTDWRGAGRGGWTPECENCASEVELVEGDERSRQSSEPEGCVRPGRQQLEATLLSFLSNPY